MYKYISKSEFIAEWKSWPQRKNQFSEEALRAIYDHLEDLEEETREPVELDIIAICCEYTEYETLQEYNDDYDEGLEDWDECEYLVATLSSGGAVVIDH